MAISLILKLTTWFLYAWAYIYVCVHIQREQCASMELGPEWYIAPYTLPNDPIFYFLCTKLIILWLFEIEISKNMILRKRDLKLQERVRCDNI